MRYSTASTDKRNNKKLFFINNKTLNNSWLCQQFVNPLGLLELKLKKKSIVQSFLFQISNLIKL